MGNSADGGRVWRETYVTFIPTSIRRALLSGYNALHTHGDLCIGICRFSALS